jgi:hypothetical protein
VDDTAGAVSEIRTRPADDARERGDAHVRLIVWCLPFGEPHGFAGCLECRHTVEPATGSLRAAEGGTTADPAAKLLTEPSQMASPAEIGAALRPRDSRSRLA